MLDISIIKIIFVTPFFIYACFTDYRERRVPNNLWVPLLTGALIFTILEFSIEYMYSLTVSAGIIIPLALILYRFGFGGADAKALIVISLLFPQFPNLFDPIHGIQLFTLSVLINSLFLSLAYPIALLISNIKKGDLVLNIFRMVTSLKKPLNDVEEGEEIVAEAYGKNQNEEIVWVSPKIPFIIPLVCGFYIAVFFGDILFFLLNQII